MEPFRLHVYVCSQEKPAGLPSCTVNGSGAVLDALRGEVVRAGLDDEVQVTTCGSLGLCTRGPNMVVYPDGVWYSGVRAEDVAEIVREHFGNGRPVTRLLSGEAAELKSEIIENRRRAREAMKAMQEGRAPGA